MSILEAGYDIYKDAVIKILNTVQVCNFGHIQTLIIIVHLILATPLYASKHVQNYQPLSYSDIPVSADAFWALAKLLDALFSVSVFFNS